MPVSSNEVIIDLGRDALLAPHAIETLQDRYMVEGETSPQHAFARAAAAFADDSAHAQRLYDYSSRGWFMFATPLLSNGGTQRGLPISCFASDTPIMTIAGYKNIADLVVGDEVITHRGHSRQIVAKKASESADTYELVVHGRQTPLVVTGNHPILTNVGWVRVDDLEVSRHLVATSGSLHVEESQHTIMFAPALSNGGGKFDRVPLPVEVPVTVELAWALGFWFAEGSTSTNGTLKVTNTDKLLCDRWGSIMSTSFGINHVVRANRNWFDGEVCSKKLQEWFDAEFGKGCRDKQLTEWLVCLPLQHLRMFYDGFYAGDGFKTTPNKAFELANPRLVAGISNILLRLGEDHTLQLKKRNRMGAFNGKLTHSDFSKTHTGSTRSGRWRFTDGLLYSRIESVKPLNQTMTVWDIQVDEDESFSAAGVIAHNCYLNYMADSRKGINSHYEETSWLSSLGGGVGGYIGVRGPESTSKGSASSGGIPFVCILDRYMLAFSQGKCYLPGTRVLTESGFKDFRDLAQGDKVAQVNPDRSMNFVEPLEIIKLPHSGTMYHFYSDNGAVDIHVTDNHGMVLERLTKRNGKKVPTGDMIKIPADAVRFHRDNRVHLAPLPHAASDDSLTAFERFQIALQADGSRCQPLKCDGSLSGCLPYTFHFHKERKIERIREILEEVDFDFTETRQNDGTTHFYVKVPLAYTASKFFDWIELTNWSGQKAEAFLAEVAEWDSHRPAGRNLFIYNTTVEDNAAAVLAIAMLAGRRARYQNVDRGETRQTRYDVFVQDEYRPFGGDSILTETYQYDGDVYCVEVPSGMLIVEYNGSPLICGNTRRGSYAAYLDISHPEIDEFLELRKPSGGDANRKALNLHHAVNISDEFMEACLADAEWHFRSPKTGEIKKTVNARALMRKIVETRHQTGEPFILFKDTANRALPESLKRQGLKINHSNLCVSGATPLLTSKGYFPINELAGQHVDVWNGEEWSEVEVMQTSAGADLLRIDLSNGASLDCTPYHKWYVVDGYGKAPREVRASELRVGDKLIKCDFPVITSNDAEAWDHPYACGFLSGDGTHAGNPSKQQIIWLYGDKRGLVGEFRDSAQSITFGEDRDTIYFGRTRLKEKFSVPHGTDLFTRLEWLAGILDSDGTAARNGSNTSLQIGSVNPEFLDEIRLLLNTLGCDPKVTLMRQAGQQSLPDGKGGEASYDCKAVYRLLINSNDTYNLLRLGLHLRRIVVEQREPQRSAKQFVTVVGVTAAGFEPTYCFTEPKRHMGVFNGVLTGNCTEIMLPTAEDRTAVCCLSSPNLATYDEWKDDPLFIEDLMRMLDNTLDDFINRAPPELWRAVNSAKMERSVGLGGMGLHTYLQDHGIVWGSDLARAYNVMMFEHLQKKTNAASLKLGAERGEAPDMAGTGHRFSHKMAVAPNASSSIFVPQGPISPSIEQWPENIFIHKTLTGSHTVRNPSLERLLETKGQNTKAVWKDILLHEGSVQHLDFLTDTEKAVFATAFETDQRLTIQMANDRAGYVDQGVSLNISVPAFVDADYMLELHFMAWAGGSKSMYYVRSKAPKKAENMNTKVAQMELVVPEDDECLACQG